MSEQKRYLLRKPTGDVAAETEQQIRDWVQRGQCKPADFLFDFSQGSWLRAGDLPGVAELWGTKPEKNPEKRLIYFMSPGTTPIQMGPFSTKEMQQKIQAREICESTWVFVEGDKQWRQVKTVKVLNQMLEPLPAEKPEAPPADSLPVDGLEPEQSSPSIRLEVGGDEVAPANPGDFVEREEATMALSTLGLSLKVDHSAPAAAAPPAPPKVPPAPPKPATPKPAPPGAEAPLALESASESAGPVPQPGKEGEPEKFDGITAEISTDPIWLIKKAGSEAVSGPFRFLEVVRYLEEGRITKSDKISKVGTNRFVKIQQQYEFNVKFSIETVVEKGVEKQKILIRRRHPRVPYFTEVQVISGKGMMAGSCVNISAGGILMEVPKADFHLGDILEIKILPGLIARPVTCHALVIGKIPKIPPGFALKFEDLKNEDKEAIEFFVQETLKREMSKNS